MQRIITRKGAAASLLQGLPEVKQIEAYNSIPASSVYWSPDGQLLAAVTEGKVSIINPDSHEQTQVIQLPNLAAVAFSPSGTYLQTFQRPQKDASNADKNLKVVDVATGKVVAQLFQKTMSKETWPALQFSSDETLLAHMVTNTVNIYSVQAFADGVQHKLFLQSVGGFALSPSPAGPALSLAAFVPALKGNSGFAGIWNVSALGKGQDQPAPQSRRSFMRASNGRFFWNSTGTAVLALTASDYDATNQSYYGEQRIYYLAADGSEDCMVPDLKEGPVHDAQWSPDGSHFIVVAGFMPAKAVLYSAKCKPVFDLGCGSYNLIKWNPQSRFFALCGFGNLPGDILFYDKKADGKCKLMSQVRAEVAVTCDWAPDGRHLLTSTTAPRLRVDNGFQIWKYSGEKLHDSRIDGLLEASWQPAKAGAFPDLPQSPRAAGSSHKAGVAAAPPQKQGYVPPHSRRADGTSSAAPFSLNSDASRPGGRMGVLRPKALVPGAAPPETKTASKNARRRKKKSGNTETDAADGDEDTAQPAPKAEQASTVDAVTNGTAALDINGSSQAQDGATDATDIAKKTRNLQKKLKQIQQLKDKQGTQALTPEQIQKLESEQAVLSELQQLGQKA